MIRAATHNDIDAVLRMGAMFYETTSYSSWSGFCHETSRKLVEMLIDTGVLLIAEIDGAACGMVGLVVAPFMFNASHMAAYEVFWWVDPDAQGAGVGRALLQAIEPACKAKGCVSIQMVCLASSPPQAAALYERVGYRHTESSFTKIMEGT